MSRDPLTQTIENVSSRRSQVITLGKGAVLGIVGLGIRTGGTYLYTYLIIHKVGSEAYGVFAIALSLVAIGMILAESGLNLSTIHFTIRSIQQNPDGGDPRKPLQRSLVLGLGMSLFAVAIFWLSAPWIAVQIYHETGLSTLIRVQALALPWFTAGNLLISFTQSFKDVRHRFWIRDLLMPIAEIAFGLFFLSIGLGIYGLAVASIAASILFCLGAALAARKYLPAKRNPQADVSYLEILRFSLPLFVSRILGILYVKVPHLLLGALAGFQISGVFNVAWDASRFATFFLLAFSGIFSPMVAEVIYQDNTPRLKELYALSTRWLLLISLPLVGALTLGAEPFMGLYGEAFRPGYSTLIILAAGQLINIGVGGTDNIIVMAGRTRLDLINNIIGLALVVGFSYALIPSYGLIGAAVAQASVIALINLLKLAEIRLLLRVHPFNRTFLKPILSVLLAAVLAVLARSQVAAYSTTIQLAISLPVFGLAYLLGLVLLRLETADILVLHALLGRMGIKIRQAKPLHEES